MIALEMKVIKNKETAYRTIEGEGLIMDPSDSSLHSLNEVACAVWEYIDSEKTVSEIVDMVTDNFTVNDQTAREDIFELLDKLTELRLVKVY